MYVIGDAQFKTKKQITDLCSHIVASVPDGQKVRGYDLPFLFDLLMQHDEWEEKSAGGVSSIVAQTTEHETRGFVLVRTDGSTIDISYYHAVKCIPTGRSKVPQALVDYREAARRSVMYQTRVFRDDLLGLGAVCPFTGERLTRDTSAVDHIYPDTFDALLFKFSKEFQVNPLHVKVSGLNGLAEFEDKQLEANWQQFHYDNAKLRLLSRIANLQQPKAKVPWSEVLS